MTLNDFYHSLDPVAFAVGPLEVRWYGLAYIAGFVCAGLVMWLVARRWKLRFDIDTLTTILLCTMVGIIFGARLGYVLVYGDGWYLQHPEDILAFNKGGMSFHGGLVGAVLGGIVAARITKMPFLTLADLAVCGAPLGLFFGRCANFVNGELWGAVTDAPWGVVFGGAAGALPRHPSQLYEAVLEGLVIFAVLFVLSRKNNPPRARGVFLGTFMVLYGVFRFAVEFVRQPDAQMGYLFGTDWLTTGQVLSVPLVVLGVALVIWAVCKQLPQCGAAAPAEDAAGEADANGEGSEDGEGGEGEQTLLVSQAAATAASPAESIETIETTETIESREEDSHEVSEV